MAVLGLLYILFISASIRLMPSKIPRAEEWAREGILGSLKSNIASQVKQQYPNLPQQSLNALIDEQLGLVLSQQKSQIEQAAKAQAEYFRQRFKDENGETYLGDIDSYYWLRYARNIVEKGIYGDEIRGSIIYDNHMFAPLGMAVKPNLYPYIEAYLYKIMSFFSKKSSLMRAAFLTPLFLSFIAIISAFLIGKKLSGNLAGLFSAALVAVNQTVLSRSLGSDNDIVNVVFPLLIMLFTIYAFDSKDIKKTLLFSFLMGLSTGLYSFAWSGWWFMFLFIIASAIIYMSYIGLYEMINKGKTIQNLLKNRSLKLITVLLAIYIISSYIGLALFGNSSQFFKAIYKNPLKIIRLKQAAKGIGIWPNVYTTVAELNSADFSQIVGSLWGKLFLWAGLLGSIVGLVKIIKGKEKINKINKAYLLLSALYYFLFIEISLTAKQSIIFQMALLLLPLLFALLASAIYSYKLESIHSILMVIWYAATIYASTKGIRFVLLIVPAFAVSFGVFIGYAVDALSKLASRSFNINKNTALAVFSVLSLILLAKPIAMGYETGYIYVPSINDAWVNALTSIKNSSSPDAIINSWWDFGHWFKYWADRPVTFDGASQNSQQAHWIGKVLLTQDEKQALSILRMLDCGSTSAEKDLKMFINDSYARVKMLYKLLGMGKNQAEQYLLSITNKENAEKIISHMFCEPPENYFITSGDMVGKSGVWAHFGSWNFERAKIYSYYKSLSGDEFINKLKEEFNYTGEQAQRLYYEISSLMNDREINNWISPWPGYIMQDMGSCKEDNSTIKCSFSGLVSQTNEHNIVAQGAVFDKNNLSNSKITLSILLRSNNQVIGQRQEKPNAVVVFDNGRFKTHKIKNSAIGFNLLLQNKSGAYRSMPVLPELTESVFTRLFYLGESDYFEKFYDATDLTGSRIIVWKVKWDKLTNNTGNK